ncbi:VMAP-C domain-containing protein [Streptomyces sp. NPDC054887]
MARIEYREPSDNAAATTDRSTLIVQRAIVDELAKAQFLSSVVAKQMLATLLERRLRTPITYPYAPGGADRELFMHLVERCTAVEATDALAEAVELMEGDTAVSQRLRTLCDLWLASSKVPQQELQKLQELLRGTSADDVHSIATASMQPLPAPLPARCTDAWQILLHLMRRNAPRSGLPPFMSFLEYLAAADEAQRPGLQAWTQARASEWNLEGALADCRRKAASALPSARDGEPRAMFVFLPDGLESDVYILRVWHHDGGSLKWPALRDEDTRLHVKDIATAVAGKLRHTLAPRSARSHLTVEFWLPMELVNEPVRDWCMPASQNSPGQYRVLVRSLDRLKWPHWDASLRERWTSLMSAGLGDDGAPAVEPLSAPVMRDADREPLVLSSPPTAPQGRRELEEAIQSGEPAVLWHRQDCSETFRRLAHEVIRRGPLRDLPRRVEDLRARDEAGVSEVTLLWDDPDRPLPVLNRLIAPDEVPAP